MLLDTARAEFKTGQTTIGTTAARLIPAGHKAYSYVYIEADIGNTNDIFVGHDGGVSSANGWRLDAGQSITIPIDDPNKIWIVGGAASQVAKWLFA